MVSILAIGVATSIIINAWASLRRSYISYGLVVGASRIMNIPPVTILVTNKYVKAMTKSILAVVAGLLMLALGIVNLITGWI